VSPGGTAPRRRRRQPHRAQHRLDRLRRRDRGEQPSWSRAVRAHQHVHLEPAPQQLAPRVAPPAIPAPRRPGACGTDRRRRRRHAASAVSSSPSATSFARTSRFSSPGSSVSPHRDTTRERNPAAGASTPRLGHQMPPRSRHQREQPLDQHLGPHHHVRGSVLPPLPRVRDPPVRQQRQPRARDRRPPRMAHRCSSRRRSPAATRTPACSEKPS
jgi:hypothetical protein